VPITKQARFILGIEDVEVLGELKMLLPKPLERKCKSKLIWTELTKIWQNDHNLVKGFLLNLVKGGYAIAIAGHIAFLPKSLRRSRKIFHSQWRIFSILNMNLKIGNIVVKDIDDGKIDFFSLAKAHRKKKRRLGIKRKHLQNTKNTFFYKYGKIKINQKSKFQLSSHGFHNPKNQTELETLGPQASSLY
jgi:hypothetical protein